MNEFKNDRFSVLPETVNSKIDWSKLLDYDRKDHESQVVFTKANKLAAFCEKLSSPVLAFSGGIDSALVAAFLHQFSKNPIAVTAVSPSLSERQKKFAEMAASQIGINHRWISTDELQSPKYQANQSDRCYHCKSHLFGHLEAVGREYSESQIVSGTNFDDLKDYRPGLQAAAEKSVLQPLADCEITKKEVRTLSSILGLTLSDRPASPCLASRIAYRVEVTEARLNMVERAEDLLWEAGFSDVRVRMMAGISAKIEVPKNEIEKLVEPFFFDRFTEKLIDLGFRDVVVDTEGLRSGNLNSLLQISTEKLGRRPVG